MQLDFPNLDSMWLAVILPADWKLYMYCQMSKLQNILVMCWQYVFSLPIYLDLEMIVRISVLTIAALQPW